ncbi:type II toxin-antitoxin system RelE/ParE family toxin [Ancrocorticia populi]|uniref:type II toxin-antitoxin system RelE/ParE family toxin n=2 Tax=Ancrocorticia populi TaxID=2175228 RepID=UPI001FAEBCD6|nr:type II toxin-antitoxin system RelE/ParE family toxin [Ancrocorticia populi]
MANQHGLPSRVTVTAEYFGLGRKQQKVTYNLDVQLMQLEGMAVSSTPTLGRLARIENELFDPARQAILLIAGDKSNNWQKWYRRNIPLADNLFDEHLKGMEA